MYQQIVGVSIGYEEIPTGNDDASQLLEDWQQQIRQENGDQQRAAHVTVHTLDAEPVAFTGFPGTAKPDGVAWWRGILQLQH